MSRRLLQLVMPIFPDRRMFRIHDPDADLVSPGGPLPPVGVLVSASREQMCVGSLQEDIDVRLVLEEWDGQPLLPDAWDEEGKARLYLRGQLSVDMGSAGTAVSRLRLSGGVGNYEVRVYARHREAVVQMYDDLFSQHKDPLSDDFQREKRKLEGVERYLVQLWRDSLRVLARSRPACWRLLPLAYVCAGAGVLVRVPAVAAVLLVAESLPARGVAAFDVAAFDVAGFDVAAFDVAAFDVAGFDVAGFGAVAWPVPAGLAAVLPVAAEPAAAEAAGGLPVVTGAVMPGWPDACGLMADLGLCARNGTMA